MALLFGVLRGRRALAWLKHRRYFAFTQGGGAADDRVTEDGTVRNTEDGSIRLTES